MRRKRMLTSKSGMELVQVGLLIGISVAIALIFRTQITTFVNNTFQALNG
ncbi:MAG: Flp1 family type IVb pilin [Eubacteriaceae bacterium]|nr:Flp1 family type IVb pilin [Eubacteriaceae bacterium]